MYSESYINSIKEELFNLNPEKIIYSSFFPYDISYKKTLLLCVFLGWMGAHCYFVKRYFKAISMSVMMFIFLLTIISMVTVLEKVETFLAPLGSWLLISGNYIIPCVMGALCVIMWISDIIKISFKKFKVPVVLQEK